MRKTLLFVTLLWISLLTACGSTQTQSTQEETQTKESGAAAPTEGEAAAAEVEFAAAVEAVPGMEGGSDFRFKYNIYISDEEKEQHSYRPYLNHYVTHDSGRAVIFEEYTPSEYSSKILQIQFTDMNGEISGIRFGGWRVSDWSFDRFEVMDAGIHYQPKYKESFNSIDDVRDNAEFFRFEVYDLTQLSEEGYVKTLVSEDKIDLMTSTFFINVGEDALLRDRHREEKEYILDEGENYSKIIYDTYWDYIFSQSGNQQSAIPCNATTMVYDDYENMKRYIVVMGGDDKVKLEDMNEIEIVDDNNLIIGNEIGSWTFPEGMTGATDKFPTVNGMSRNITTYTTPSNQEMVFHWYGPGELGMSAYVEDEVLTLTNPDKDFKLNAQIISRSEIKDAYDIGSYGLRDYEHCVEGSDVEHYEEGGELNLMIFPITDDNGYKGYAVLLLGSGFANYDDVTINTPKDNTVYFFTYVEKEDIYDDERALDVIGSLDYHLGLEGLIK